METGDYADLPEPHGLPCATSVKSLHVVVLPNETGGCQYVRLISYHSGVAFSKLCGCLGKIMQYNWNDVPGSGKTTQRLALHGLIAGLGGMQLSSHHLIQKAPAVSDIRRSGSDCSITKLTDEA
eukprot:5406085-Amphidinium_carterae.1